MQALVPSLWKGSPPYETRGEPADASRERLGSNGSGSGGGPAASVEEKRILATRMQKAANNGFDVLSLLEKGADPTSAGAPSLPGLPPTRTHTMDVACAHILPCWLVGAILRVRREGLDTRCQIIVTIRDATSQRAGPMLCMRL